MELTNLDRIEKLQGLHVVGSGRPANRLLLTLAARIAIHQIVRAIDVGCSLDMHHVAREVRREGTKVYDALENIRLSRAFGCWQAGESIRALPMDETPLLVFDLPTPFYDEAVSFTERLRLMRDCTMILQEHADHAPVMVSARPSINEADQAILTCLLESADEVHLIDDSTPAEPAQMSLF